MQFQMTEPSLDRDKLLDVVHYICAKCSSAELGNVKLHKILYFSDMLHYLSTGRALTGVEYRKQKFGPVARHLSWAVDRLIENGQLEVVDRDYFGFKKLDYKSIQEPITRRLGNEAIQILNDVMDFVCARSAREISELSHNAAWQAVEVGETIPYYSAYGLIPSEITEEDLTAASAEARDLLPVG